MQATMFLRAVSAFPVSTRQGNAAFSPINGLSSSSSSCSSSPPVLTLSPRRGRNSFAVSASAESGVLTGVVFQPFEEVKKEAYMVPIAPQVSIARQFYEDECEAALNEQIKSVS